MEISKRTGMRISALTVLVLIVPLFVFPRQFGTELARGSLVNALYELVYYGFVMFLANRQVTLLQLIQVSGVCLIFRLAMGALFGLLVSALYSMGLSISLQLGMTSYLPAILFHVAVAPFVLWPVARDLIRPKKLRRAAPSGTAEARNLEIGGTSIAISRERGVVSDSTPQSVPDVQEVEDSPEQAAVEEPAVSLAGSDTTGFDRATYYIGEHGSVNVAAVVDFEGLLLSNFRRGEADPEEWAPMALLLAEANRKVLGKVTSGLPERLDLLVGGDRLVIVRQDWYSLVVVADRQTDDFLNIRISQGMEIIRKYVEERYSQTEHNNAEMTYV